MYGRSGFPQTGHLGVICFTFFLSLQPVSEQIKTFSLRVEIDLFDVSIFEPRQISLDCHILPVKID
jgi:hypothetical protein